jgi:hypothetical protein
MNTGPNSIQYDVWTHCAIVRDANPVTRSWHLFINGIERTNIVNTTGSSTTDVSGRFQYDIHIGSSWRGGSIHMPFEGYFDEFRLVQGVAVYTGNFTVPTTRLATTQSAGTNIAAITGSATKFLMHSNLGVGSLPGATFADSSGTPHSITKSSTPIHSTLYNVAENTVVASAMAYTASGKTFGSLGAYFDGTGDWLTIADSDDLDWGTGDFTIDFWVYMPTVPGNYYVCGMYAGGYGGLQFHSAAVYWYTAAGVSVTFAWNSWVANQWHHVALARSGTDLKFFVDGTQRGSTVTSHTHDYSAGSTFYIGTFNETVPFLGYIDNFRISKGIARYTANFTPDTKIYGTTLTQTLPTSPLLTLTGATTPALASDEDIEFTSVINPTKPATKQHLTDTGIGLVLNNLSGGDKNKATLTGTIATAASETQTNMAIKAQVRKTLGDAAYNNSTLVTFSGSTTTVGLAPGMPLTGTGISIAGPLTCGLTNTDATVTCNPTTNLVVGMQVNAFTGVPAGATILSIITDTSFELSANATATDADAKLTFNTIIASVDSTTTLTLSNVTTLGSQTGNTLIFEDLTRVTHINGADVLAGGDTMMTIATGVASTDPVLFNARRYIGHGAARSITGFGFKPDMVWTKKRSATESHGLCDSVRGSVKRLFPDVNTAPQSSTGGLTSFNADGFTTSVGYGTDSENNATYIAWGWKAGGVPSGSALSLVSGVGAGTIANGASGVSNLTSLTQSVSQTSGFSITTFDGYASGGTFPHNLGAEPDFIISKGGITTAAAYDWTVWHRTGLSATTTKYLKLNETFSEASASDFFPTVPSSTIVTIGGRNDSGGVDDHDFVYYCWKTVAGVSSFGTYEGSGSASTKTVTLPNSETFTPKMVLIKNVDAISNWRIYDTFRGTGTAGNSDAEYVNANTNSAPNTSGDSIIFGAGQFTMTTTAVDLNAANTYIYAAFA